MYTAEKTRLDPVNIKPQQARSLCRILNKAGRHADFATIQIDEHTCPCFIGVTAAEIVAAAHYIPSLAGLPWLKIVLEEDKTAAGQYFASSLLRWSN